MTWTVPYDRQVEPIFLCKLLWCNKSCFYASKSCNLGDQGLTGAQKAFRSSTNTHPSRRTGKDKITRQEWQDMRQIRNEKVCRQ